MRKFMLHIEVPLQRIRRRWIVLPDGESLSQLRTRALRISRRLNKSLRKRIAQQVSGSVASVTGGVPCGRGGVAQAGGKSNSVVGDFEWRIRHSETAANRRCRLWAEGKTHARDYIFMRA